MLPQQTVVHVPNAMNVVQIVALGTIVVSALNVRRVNQNRVVRHSQNTALNQLAKPRVCRWRRRFLLNSKPNPSPLALRRWA